MTSATTEPELCLDCRHPLVPHVEDREMPGSSGARVVLVGVTVNRCSNCENYEVEVPRLSNITDVVETQRARSTRPVERVRFVLDGAGGGWWEIVT